MQVPLHGGPTFAEVLLHPTPDMARLREIKDYAKSLRDDPDSGMPSEICHVLYYAAIAAAQLNTRDLLTSLDFESLRRGLAWTLTLQWLPQSLNELFQRALHDQKS
jgi:hypothetical protein